MGPFTGPVPWAGWLSWSQECSTGDFPVRWAIAHTRWATHGVPAEGDAHPHVSGGLAVVHNGIIENHQALREQLEGLGYCFTSDTDTETIADLIEACRAGRRIESAEGDLFSSVRCAVGYIKGAHALAVVSEDEPESLIVARERSPLIVGLGEDGHYAASDASALLSVTRRMMYLENGDVARLNRSGMALVDGAGEAAVREVITSSLSADAVRLGEFSHYMQEEVFEQPQALGNTLEMVAGTSKLQAGVFGADAAGVCAEVDSVLILACGTSSYAGMVARYWIESIVGLPCNLEIASEYRYRKSVFRPQQLVVAISHSGKRRIPSRRCNTQKPRAPSYFGHLQCAGVGHRSGSRLAVHHPRWPGNRCSVYQSVYHPVGDPFPVNFVACSVPKPAAAYVRRGLFGRTAPFACCGGKSACPGA